MGLEIDREEFDDDDHDRFAGKLRACLTAMRLVAARPGFGAGEPTMGAELELNLVDAHHRPAFLNREVLAHLVDDRVTLELDRFNLEINAPPFPLRGRPFSATARELSEAMAATRRAAKEHGANIVAIGILPTLREEDLTHGALTEGRRYRALSASLRRLRRSPFPLHVRGEDELRLDAEDVTYEGANTSFQVHLRAAPDAFASTYNAAQMATAVALAVAGNSPMFLGRRLWDETRIALFRQAVDDRQAGDDDWRPSRVSFGHGWVRKGAVELFEESVHLHAPLLPVCSDEDPIAAARLGIAPSLAELRLHHGTVWRWNRAVYDEAAGGHFRVELRALPAGPTVTDMVANAAFLLGLTLGLRDDADALVTKLTFGHARRNFYEAARRGLDAELLWPSECGVTPFSATALAARLLPLARHGLLQAGVEPDEADACLDTIDRRLATRTTGARWQRRAFAEALATTANREAAAARMLARYSELSETEAPVHSWPHG